MVIIELRDKNARKASNLYELLYHPDDNTRQAIARDIEKREGKGLLLFLDGYDELSEFQHSEFSVIHKILINKLLSKATVVVTSRPTATVKLPTQFKQLLQQYIKIAGFTKNDILSYITSTCRDNLLLLDDLRSYVFKNSFILSVMYNPLHCTIVTEVYIDHWRNGQKGFAPNTLTELYKSLVYNLLRHNLPENRSDVQKFSDLPEVMKNQLMILAEFAANGLNQSQYVFTDAPDVKLGLMVPIRKLNKLQEGQTTSYMFLHLTLQEYLAAFYWSNHPDQQPSDLMEPKVIKSIEINFYEDGDNMNGNTRWPLLLFLAGLTKLRSFTFDHMMQEYNPFLIFQLLLETQSPRLVSAVFSNKTTSITQLSLFAYKHGHYSLAYCIINSGNTSTWRINLILKDLQKLSNIFHYVRATNWDETTGPLIELNYNDDPSIPVLLFSHIPFAKSISKLIVMNMDSDRFFKLVDNSYFPSLNLKALSLPKHNIQRHHKSFLKGLQLPQTLISLDIICPYDLLLYNLNQYPDLNELYISADECR